MKLGFGRILGFDLGHQLADIVTRQNTAHRNVSSYALGVPRRRRHLVEAVAVASPGDVRVNRDETTTVRVS
jgi:hypothetical protein